jgi:hypothetical protein
MGERLDDNNRKWLIERQVDQYVMWIGLWLVCLLGNASILTTIVLNDALHIANLDVIIVVYIGLIGGMIFSVYRLANITSIINSLAWEIEDNALRNFILNNRGWVLSLAVDDRGRLRKLRLVIIFILHSIVFLILLYFALL